MNAQWLGEGGSPINIAGVDCGKNTWVDVYHQQKRDYGYEEKIEKFELIGFAGRQHYSFKEEEAGPRKDRLGDEEHYMTN